MKWSLLLFSLGFTDAQATEIKVSPQVEISKEVIDKIIAAARLKYPGTPEEVRIGPWRLSDPRLAVVTFQKEINGTEAKFVEYIAYVPAREESKPSPLIHLVDGPLTGERLDTKVLRVFPLKSTTCYLELDKQTSYDEVLALLHAIDGDHIKFTEPEKYQTTDGKNRYRSNSVSLPRAADLAKLSWVQANPKNQELSIHIDSNSGADAYTFRKENGVFRCTSASSLLF